MAPAELTALFTAAGWVAAAMFGAVLAGSPGGLNQRTGGWLVVAALLQALAAMTFTNDLRLGIGLFAAQAWWEAARQWHNATAARRISGWWHLVPLELLALAVALGLGSSASTRPEWFLPGEALIQATPAMFAVIALGWWWRAARGSFRAAGAGFALACLVPAGTEWGAGLSLSLAWLAAAGLGVGAWAEPATRSRAALIFLAGFGLAVPAVPFGAALAEDRADDLFQTELAAAAVRSGSGLRGPRLATLGTADPVGRETGRTLARAADDLRARDSALRAAGLWRLRDGRVERLAATGDFAPDRLSTTAERAGVTRSEPFVTVPARDSPTGAVIAHAPLLATRFESPVAWLALEYPAALRAGRLESARRAATAGLALLAVGCAGIFVLVVRQGREAAQRTELEQARAADRAKTEFLAFLGHELRTPLQVILGRAEQLAPARPMEAGAITTQGRAMLRMVNDLLDLGTLEAGRLVLHPEPFPLRRVVAGAAEFAHSAATAKRLAWSVHVEPALPETVLGDEARLLQVLGNLLGNAVKYTGEGGVEFRVELAGPFDGAVARVRFVVRDTGIGLPPDKIAQLFTLFTRLDSGSTFTREGTGVGLALVKRLVERMDGTVAAANRKDRRGADFVVELPLPVVETVPASAATDTAVAAVAPRADASAMRMLVVEDHAAVGALMLDFLRELGHSAEWAADGAAARAALAGGQFDVVVLDVHLPDIDGIALAREIGARPSPPRIIGCSAEVLPATRDAALAAGMEVFLAKPISREQLRAALARKASAGAVEATLFEALRTAPESARVRELAIAELALIRAALAEAKSRGDRVAIEAALHRLRNTALVLGDAALLKEADQAAAGP